MLGRPSSAVTYLQEGVLELSGALVAFTFVSPSSLYRVNETTKKLETVSTISGPYGASDALYFEEGGHHYMLVANYWNGEKTTVESALYGLDPDSGAFTHLQDLPTAGARAWAECPVEGAGARRTFAVASFTSGTTTVYEFTY